MGVFSWLHYLTYAKKTKLVDFHYKSLKSWKINNSDLTQQLSYRFSPIFIDWLLLGLIIAYKFSRALWWQGGKRKESLQLHLWNLNICIKKIDPKCWLAGMTLVMLSIPLVHAFTCFSLFLYIRTDFSFALIKGNLTAQSRWRACSQEIIKCENWTWLHHTHNLLMTWSSTLTGSADNKLNQCTRILKQRNYNTRGKQWTMKNQRELELPT